MTLTAGRRSAGPPGLTLVAKSESSCPVWNSVTFSFVSARSSRVFLTADGAGFPSPVPGFRASYRGVWEIRVRGTKRRWSVCSGGTTVPGLGSPGCASLTPGGTGSYHGPAAWKMLHDGRYRVTELHDRPGCGCAFPWSQWSLLFPSRARQL